MLQVGNGLNSYFLSIFFMFHSSLFSLVIIPFRVIYLLFSPPLAPIKGVLWVVLFLF